MNSDWHRCCCCWREITQQYIDSVVAKATSIAHRTAQWYPKHLPILKPRENKNELKFLLFVSEFEKPHFVIRAILRCECNGERCLFDRYGKSTKRILVCHNNIVQLLLLLLLLPWQRYRRFVVNDAQSTKVHDERSLWIEIRLWWWRWWHHWNDANRCMCVDIDSNSNKESKLIREQI